MLDPSSAVCETMATTIFPRKRQRVTANETNATSPLVDEKVLLLVLRKTNWDPFMLCFSACVCKKLSCIAKRILWKEFCMFWAPRTARDLLAGSKNGHVDGGWQALGKLMFYCPGCSSDGAGGHFVTVTRFSQRSGKSFLVPKCREDVLYISDPCEHEENVGVFRGVFRGFGKSLTRRMLIDRSVKLEEEQTCPYCRVRVWRMSSAKMVPNTARKKLLAAGEVEYFLCLNGHVSGHCSLIPLSDSEHYNSRKDVLGFSRVDKFRQHSVYYHGCLKDFIKITKWRGPQVLYLGDHIYSDLRGPAKAGWRTAAIIHELEREIRIQNEDSYRVQQARYHIMQDLLGKFHGLPLSSLGGDEERTLLMSLREERQKAREAMKTMFNPYFGSTFLTDTGRESAFAYNVQRYADIYTSKLENLLQQSSDAWLCTPYDVKVLPHHIKVDASILLKETCHEC